MVLHTEYANHDPSQFTGQPSVLQFWVSEEDGQAAPLLAGSVVMDKVRVWVPVLPQGPAHVPQLLQEETQFTGQPPVLQVWVSGDAGHAVPPLAGVAVMLSVRIWVPEPHGKLQLPQVFQDDTQFTTTSGLAS